MIRGTGRASMKTITNVDDYINSSPADIRNKLSELRAVIRKNAPDASEKISYGMPYYGFMGRLAYFRYAKTHIGLYIPPPVLEKFAQELAPYSTATATVRFPLIGIFRLNSSPDLSVPEF